MHGFTMTKMSSLVSIIPTAALNASVADFGSRLLGTDVTSLLFLLIMIMNVMCLHPFNAMI